MAARMDGLPRRRDRQHEHRSARRARRWHGQPPARARRRLPDAGRGRLDRTWEAPPGANLLVSLAFTHVPAGGGHAHATDRTRGRRRHPLARPGFWVRPRDRSTLHSNGRTTCCSTAGSWPGSSPNVRRSRGLSSSASGLNVGWAPEDAAKLGGDDRTAGHREPRAQRHPRRVRCAAGGLRRPVPRRPRHARPGDQRRVARRSNAPRACRRRRPDRPARRGGDRRHAYTTSTSATSSTPPRSSREPKPHMRRTSRRGAAGVRPATTSLTGCEYGRPFFDVSSAPSEFRAHRRAPRGDRRRDRCGRRDQRGEFPDVRRRAHRRPRGGAAGARTDLR